MTTRAQTPESDIVDIDSRAVILATGAGVPLLHKLGWDTFPNHLLGVQTVVAFEASSVEIYLGRRWAPEGFAWSIPLGDGTAKVGLLSDRDGPQYLRRFLERPDVASRIRGEPGPIKCSILPLGFLPRSYGDRLLVVGEAAGHVKATTCGGIYYGMLTAALAAEVLNEALDENQLGHRRLVDYETKWRNLLEDEIDVGLKLRRAFKFASDSMLDRLVSLAGKDGIAKIIQAKADFDWHRELIGEVFRHATVGRLLGALSTNGEEALSFAPLEPTP
jgi:flavin-dependent dehydrogenase